MEAQGGSPMLLSELQTLVDGSRADVGDALNALKLGGLSRRCKQCGISDEELEELQDQDDPKLALIELGGHSPNNTDYVRTSKTQHGRWCYI